MYFTDTGLVKGDAGVRFENAVAVMLRKQVHQLVVTRGCDAGLHYIRTKDGAEVDFSLSLEGSLSHLVECKLADSSPHRALSRFALQFPEVARGSNGSARRRPQADPGSPCARTQGSGRQYG